MTDIERSAGEPLACPFEECAKGCLYWTRKTYGDRTFVAFHCDECGSEFVFGESYEDAARQLRRAACVPVLVAALYKVGCESQMFSHHAWCAMAPGNADPCDCGISDLIAEVESALDLADLTDAGAAQREPKEAGDG